MLIDTNIFLEIVFSQAKSDDCQKLLNAIDQRVLKEKAYITRFSLSAIQALSRKEKIDFVREILLMIWEEKLNLLEMSVEDDLTINSVRLDLDLDFDDTVEYIAAHKLGTYLVTYDKDFKKTSLPTKTPAEVLKEILI